MFEDEVEEEEEEEEPSKQSRWVSDGLTVPGVWCLVRGEGVFRDCFVVCLGVVWELLGDNFVLGDWCVVHCE